MGGTPDLERAVPHEERLAALAAAFVRRFGRQPEAAAEAPGRVNLIGEHLDYNEGLVLPAAIDRSLMVAFSVRPDAEVRFYSANFDQASCFSLDRPIVRDDEHPWSNYLRGAFWCLREEGFSGPGLDMLVAGDVPVGAGLASSAALEVAGLGALQAAWGLDLDGRRLALLGQRVENAFVGVQCGIMDQLVSALGVAGRALLIDCRSLQCQAVPLGLEAQGVALVAVDSALPRRLERSEYNLRRQECAEALKLLRCVMKERPPVALRDVSGADLAAHGGQLPPTLHRRVRHVVSEMDRVAAGVRALRNGDLDALGRLMSASHASLRDDFQVSCPELDLLTELAQSLPGVLGVRLTGAGFGGCTVNLVREEAAPAFAAQVAERYNRATGLSARMYLCRAAGGLRVWPLK